jgi:hypothetical protein
VAVLSDSATGLLASAFYVLLGGWLVSLQISARDSVNRRWEAYGVARSG